MRRFQSSVLWGCLGTLSLALAVNACSEEAGRSGIMTGGSAGSSSGASTGLGGNVAVGAGGASATAAGGVGGVLNQTMGMGGNGGEACNQFMIEFEPKTPIVYVLVDRSSSMWDTMPTYWDPLQAAVLSVIQETENDVLYGFGTFTGIDATTCPILDEVPDIAMGNYAAIEALYTSLGNPALEYGSNGQTPTPAAVDATTAKLAALDPDAPKFILLVTDGAPDFCNDPHVPCGIDALIGSLQNAYAQGIGTFVMGIAGQVPEGVLQMFANAGAGQAVGDTIVWAEGMTPSTEIQYQCQGPPQNGVPHGVYAAPAGTATFFSPAADETVLVEQLRSIVTGVKPCEYELGGNIEVDINRLDEAHIYIDQVEVPLDPVNGWSMATGTVVQFNGAACEQLRSPTATSLVFDFPCEIIVVE